MVKANLLLSEQPSTKRAPHLAVDALHDTILDPAQRLNGPLGPVDPVTGVADVGTSALGAARLFAHPTTDIPRDVRLATGTLIAIAVGEATPLGHETSPIDPLACAIGADVIDVVYQPGALATLHLPSQEDFDEFRAEYPAGTLALCNPLAIIHGHNRVAVVAAVLAATTEGHARVQTFAFSTDGEILPTLALPSRDATVASGGIHVAFAAAREFTISVALNNALAVASSWLTQGQKPASGPLRVNCPTLGLER